MQSSVGANAEQACSQSLQEDYGKVSVGTSFSSPPSRHCNTICSTFTQRGVLSASRETVNFIFKVPHVLQPLPSRRAVWCSGNVLEQYSGRVLLESLPRHKLHWRRFFFIFLCPPRKCWDSTLIRLRPFPYISFPFHNLSVVFPFDALWSDVLTTP
jgi:hypothetical protein